MNGKATRKILKDLFASLEGDWMLVGGALLHFLELSDRETIDIDLVPLQKTTNADQLKVIDIAVKNGLPPEAINFAAEYFVKKQKNWRRDIVLIYESKNARIYRPSRKLFRKLKEARGTETDLLDIITFERGVKD